MCCFMFDFSHGMVVLCVSIIPFAKIVFHIALYGFTTLHLFIHLLMNVSVVSSFWLLYVKYYVCVWTFSVFFPWVNS